MAVLINGDWSPNLARGRARLASAVPAADVLRARRGIDYPIV
jgi:hypothetical protein